MARPHANEVALRVVVVDDNQDCADSTGRLLELLGCEVLVVVRSAEATETVSKFVPDLVLLDLVMPETDGFDLARLIRAELSGPGVVIAAVTGLADEATRRRCRREGFDKFFAKPVGIHQFKELLDELRHARSRPGANWLKGSGCIRDL
jgi:CheY-like chemotaxis protein